MKIITLLTVVTVCVFAAGYAVFNPRTSDAPELGKSDGPSVKDPAGPKPGKLAAVPERSKPSLIPPPRPKPEAGHEPEAAPVEKIESAKAASPPRPVTAKEAPATAKEAAKLAPGKLSVPPGHQAVVVERAQEWVGGLSAKVAGSRVNVFGMIRDQDGKPQSKMILRDVLVLADDHDRVDDKGRALPWLTTLAVAKDDLPVIEEAKRHGPVSIITKLFHPESSPEFVGPPAPEAPPTAQAPQAPRGPVIIIESPNLPVIRTGSPNLPTIRTGAPKLPVIIEGPR